MAPFEPLYTADEMRAAEAGHDVDELMQRAGRAVADEVLRRFGGARTIAAVCGGGANGGDGRIAARILADAGREVHVVDAQEERPPGPLGAADLILDALFGTGFSGTPRPDAEAWIAAMNAAGAPVLAVDLPSGVDASTGEVAGAVVSADASVTFHGPKVGAFVAPGCFHAGEVVVADIGLAPAATAHELVTPAVLALVRPRSGRDNKYTAGSVLVVGGSPGLTGAVCLSAEAAFRADAGYVAVAVPPASMPVVEQRLLEAVKRPLEEVDELAERAHAVAIGPGLGRGADARALVSRLLRELDVPVVLDADALFGLEPFEREAPTVLTPHEGELARLLGEESQWVAAHRLQALHRAIERFRCVVLLKGADTLVSAPGEPVLVRKVNAPGLATAGTGDVLTGIVAAFLARRLRPSHAAIAAATAQAVAARLAPTQRGLVASDVIAALPRAFG
jgi:NAD(P)H-hydrate epimerase